MMYKVTQIEFDFESDDEYIWNTGEQQQIVDKVTSTIWEANDEDDLIEKITYATGWCIKSIDYFVPQIY